MVDREPGDTGRHLHHRRAEWLRVPAWIPGAHDFAIEEPASPDFFGSVPNNNTLSSVLVIDENGNVVHWYEQFNFFDIVLVDIGAYLQPGSATSTAFALGLAGQQLHPFAYQAGQ